MANPHEGHAMRLDRPQQNGGEDQYQQHGNRCSVGCGGDGDERNQREVLATFQAAGPQQQEMERKNAKSGKNIGEKDRGEPRQGGD
ncbi:MAG: hypothetical protein WCC81_10970 [Pseudolabrys sp.]